MVASSLSTRAMAVKLICMARACWACRAELTRWWATCMASLCRDMRVMISRLMAPMRATTTATSMKAARSLKCTESRSRATARTRDPRGV